MACKTGEKVQRILEVSNHSNQNPKALDAALYEVLLCGKCSYHKSHFKAKNQFMGREEEAQFLFKFKSFR